MRWRFIWPRVGLREQRETGYGPRLPFTDVIAAAAGMVEEPAWRGSTPPNTTGSAIAQYQRAQGGERFPYPGQFC